MKKVKKSSAAFAPLLQKEIEMKIVIIGLGTIGETVLGSLEGEGHTVTLIDEDERVIESLIEKYDVAGVVGNGASMSIQKEAGVKGADLVVALTCSDELNILCCLVAKNLGVKSTAARVRNPDYRRQITEMKDELGISMVINPEEETANEIFNIINLPSIAQIEHFARGKVSLVEVVAEEGCLLVGETLYSLGKKLTSKVLICAVQRGNEVIIPGGDFMIEKNDRIYFTSEARVLSDFLTEVNLVKSRIKDVLIAGGGRTSYYLAEKLSGKKYRVKLIEEDPERAEKLAEELPKTTVICGKCTAHSLLLEEGIEETDAFVALSDGDEENLLLSMFANKMKVRKSIARIKGDDLYEMLGELGVQNNVSPKSIVSGRILSYIRALANKRGSNVLTLYRLVGNRVEALEFAAKKKEYFYSKPLRELRMKKGSLIASIIRGEEVIIPDGNSSIELGDNVIVVTTHKNFDDLNDLFQ